MADTQANGTGKRDQRSRLCIVTPYPPAPSETFIKAHVYGLPARTLLVHGWRPTVNARPVLSLPVRLFHKAMRIALSKSLEVETTAAYLKVFREFKAQAVLAEYGTTGTKTVPACRQLGLPLIVHFHGFDASVRSVLEEHLDAYSVMFKEAAAVIAVSREMQRKLISLGAQAEKVHYNPYGIDCSMFGGAKPEEADPIFLAVGRFVEKKAPQLTISAFAQVYRAEKRAQLRMIGDGPLLNESRRLASELGINQAVTFLGLQPPEIIQREMRNARCFVQHSLQAPNGDCEGTPVGILEAGASGLPVVSTRHAGIPDVVQEGQTGLLVDERDVDGMAAHMIEMVHAPRLAGELGQNARYHIEQHFSREQRLGALWMIIQSAIAGHGKTQTL